MRCFLPAVVVLAVGLSSGALTAQDPGGAWVEILEPSEWRGEGTRGIGIQAGRSIRVVGLAHHPSGVQRVLINGLRATVSPDPSGTVRFVGYVQVDPALVDVEVAVYPHEAPPMVRGFGVRPQPAPSTATAADAASAAGFGGKRWAVIVGVSEYEDSRIPALRFADDDARAMYEFLTSDAAGLGGFDPENVLLLVNEQATFRNLRTALFDFLKGPTEDDIVLIYFAGHGAPDPERLEDLYLLPYDTDVEALAGTAFPMADVTSAVRRTYARDLVVITDACHSAGVGGQAGLREVGLNQINRSFLNQLESSTGGIAVFTASEANQLSREGEQWGGGHGIFTWKILEALRGAADENGDRIVALGEMMEYVRDQVRRETRNAQIPTIGQTAFDRSWPMGIVLAPPGLAAVGPESPTVVAPEPEPEPAIEEEPEPAAVEAPSVASILLDRTELELEAGRTITVNALPRARDGSWLDGRPVEWSSTDVNVARVDAQGRVTGVSPGQARIAVTSGGISARLPVSVTPSVVDDAVGALQAEHDGEPPPDAGGRSNEGVRRLTDRELRNLLRSDAAETRITTNVGMQYQGTIEASGPAGLTLRSNARDLPVNLTLESIAQVTLKREVAIRGAGRTLYEWVGVWPTDPNQVPEDLDYVWGRTLRLIYSPEGLDAASDTLRGRLLGLPGQQVHFAADRSDTIGIYPNARVSFEEFDSNASGSAWGLVAGGVVMALTAASAGCFLGCPQVILIPGFTTLIGTFANDGRGWRAWDPEPCSTPAVLEQGEDGLWLIEVAEPGDCTLFVCPVAGQYSEAEALVVASKRVAVLPGQCQRQ